MPATAGRVRMPANNRVHSSAALQTHGIWQSAIGYDPYAPTNNNDKDASRSADRSAVGDGGDSGENAYASFQGLLALARITGTNADDTRGACKKCGRVGHLAFQCRNFLSLKADREKDDAVADEAQALFHELKRASGRTKEESEEEEEEEEEESSDSDLDPEIEKIIAARFGKKAKKKGGSERRERSNKSSKRSRRDEEDEDGDWEEDERKKEKRRRVKDKRRSRNSDDEEERHRHRKSRKERKRRSGHKRRDGSDDESEEDSHRNAHNKDRNRRKDGRQSDSDDRVAVRHRKRRREERRASPSSSDASSSSSDKDDLEKTLFEKKSSGRNRNSRTE